MQARLFQPTTATYKMVHIDVRLNMVNKTGHIHTYIFILWSLGSSTTVLIWCLQLLPLFVMECKTKRIKNILNANP